MGRPGINKWNEKPKRKGAEDKQDDQGEGWGRLGLGGAPPILLIID